MSEASTTAETASDVSAAQAAPISDTWFRRQALALLGQLRGCEITLIEGGRTQ